MTDREVLWLVLFVVLLAVLLAALYNTFRRR